MCWESSTKAIFCHCFFQRSVSIRNALTARDAARLRSTTGKRTGALLNAIPTSEVFALKILANFAWHTFFVWICQ